MKNRILRRAISAALLVAFAVLELSACRANLAGSGRNATVTLRLARPAEVRSSRLILDNASWLRVALTADGDTETYQQDSDNPTFKLSVKLGETYSVAASAGRTDESGTDTTLYAASASLTVGETQSLTLFLLPVETTPWPEIDADTYAIAPGDLPARSTATFRVRLGSASRWYINTATGYGTDLQLYVQNEDGSAVTPSAYAADRLVVEKSSLSSGATSFLLTMYNASTTAISADSTTMVSYRDSCVGTLVFETTLASMDVGSMPTGITYLNNKLYVTALANSFLYSLNTYDMYGTLFASDASYQGPWGIATDGTNLYFANQGGGTPGVRQLDAGGSLIWSSVVPNASGVAVLGSYVYVTYNSAGQVYRVPVTGGGASLFAGNGSGSSLDGNLASASFYWTAGICTDGTDLYVIETGTRKVRKIDMSAGYVSTFAGSGADIIEDGVGTAASFASLNHITSDGAYLYLTDSDTLRRIKIATAEVETLFAFPAGITPDGLVKVGDAFYLADSEDDCVYKVY